MRVDVTIDDNTRFPNGLATVVVNSAELDLSEVLDLEIEVLHKAFQPMVSILSDLLLIAGAAYLLDKTVPRRFSPIDGWTRQFSVHCPVADPDAWRAAQEPLLRALNFLTGDEWEWTFMRSSARLFVPNNARTVVSSPSEVAAVSLFSGGLDSLTGTLDALITSEIRLALVGHHDATTPAGDQRRVHAALDGLDAYAGRTDLHRVRLRPLPPSLVRPGQVVRRIGTEWTQRSRSLVFIALGICAAHSAGPQVPLLVPENGFIAVNLPLTPSRIGTCSTRTTHPFFLKSLRSALVLAGISNELTNPFLEKTKGEVIVHCKDQDAIKRLASITVSCSHSSRRTYWRRKEAGNCGYCYPCLIRRAALFAAGLDKGTDYGLDVCVGELPAEMATAADYRALLDAIANLRSFDDVLAALVSNGGLDEAERLRLAPMVWRGIEELRSFVTEAGSDEMRRLAAA